MENIIYPVTFPYRECIQKRSRLDLRMSLQFNQVFYIRLRINPTLCGKYEALILRPIQCRSIQLIRIKMASSSSDKELRLGCVIGIGGSLMLRQYSKQGMMQIWQDRSWLRLLYLRPKRVPVRRDVLRNLDHCSSYLKPDEACY